MFINKVFLLSAFLLISAAFSAKAAHIIVPVTKLMSAPNSTDLNITSPVEDYVIQHERQFDLNLYLYDEEMNALKVAYMQRYETLDAQPTLLSFKLREEMEKINPLELLNDWNKHCVQKYRHQYQQIETYQTYIKTCRTTAYNYNVIGTPQTTRTQLKNYYTGTYRTAQNNCKKTYGNNTESEEFKNCAIKAVDAALVYSISNRKTFDTQMFTENANANSRINTALDCSLNHFYKASIIMGETSNLIQTCIDGSEYCPKCSTAAAATQASCDYVVDLIVHEEDFYNATMHNPLLNLNHNLTCLQVNLWKK